jgi:hypothetical protein
MLLFPQPARTQALGLSRLHPSEVGSGKGFGRLGGRIYEGKQPFVADLRTIAQKNDCCIFVARDRSDIAYLAEQNLKPPPTALTYEVRDSASLVEYINRASARPGIAGERPVVFLDEPKASVEALAANFQGPDDYLTLARAESLGDPVTEAANRRVSGVEDRDLNGQRAAVTLTDVPKARSAVIDLARFHSPDVWRSAKVSVLDRESVNSIMRAAGWDTARDGTPMAVKISFGPGGSGASPGIDIMAGFGGNDAESGSATLLVHRDAVSVASRKGASLAQILMTVRNEIKQLPQIQLRRLIGVIHDQDTPIIVTRLESQGGFNTCA